MGFQHWTFRLLLMTFATTTTILEINLERKIHWTYFIFFVNILTRTSVVAMMCYNKFSKVYVLRSRRISLKIFQEALSDFQTDTNLSRKAYLMSWNNNFVFAKYLLQLFLRMHKQVLYKHKFHSKNSEQRRSEL